MSPKARATPEINESSDPPKVDFAGAMRQLADEADRSGARTGGGEGGLPSSKSVPPEFLLAVGQMVRPLAVSVTTLSRTLAEHGQMLSKLVGVTPPAPPPPPADLAPVHTALDGVRHQLTRLGSVETANQKLFDALHAELKGYKDGFLFDALQKPFVRDLITLHDDLSAIHQQIAARREAAVVTAWGDEPAFLETLAQNLDNVRSALMEIFSRLDVESQRTPEGETMDKRIHRVLSFEPATGAEQDNCVARSLRPGFLWRGRAVRPEDVVARKWAAPPAEDV